MNKPIFALIGLIIVTGLASAGYSQHFNNFYGANDTEWNMLSACINVYEDTVGDTIFWGIFLSIPFVAMYIKQESVIVPSIIMLISGGLLTPLLPPEFDLPVKMMLAIGITGLFWHIFIKRR